MALYDSIDIDFTWDGDIYSGLDGDIGDTKDDYIRSLVNEVRTLVRSDFDDWEKHPTHAANLSDFRGEPNTRENGKRIEQRVFSKLTASGIVKAEDLALRVVPVSVSQVLIIITINATSTPRNSLQVGQSIVVSFIYDSYEDSVFFLPETSNSREARSY